MVQKDKKYLSVKDIADYLSISPATVRQYIKSNQLEAVRFGNSNLLKISQESFNKFISERKVNTK